ncbi:MAG TPA: hypothetical protein VN668_13525 [Stellaceae bacterium]|nr:hypothetical protein [Stellaceae bacterium]
MLQQGVEGVGPAGIEPQDIEEEAPGHGASPNEHEPAGREHHRNCGELIEEQGRTHHNGHRARIGDELNPSRSRFSGRGEIELGTAADRNEPLAAEDGLRGCATRGAPGNAAHSRKVQAVAGADSRSIRGRCLGLAEWPDDVGDVAVIVSRQAEGAEWRHDAVKVRNDHHQRPKR